MLNAMKDCCKEPPIEIFALLAPVKDKQGDDKVEKKGVEEVAGPVEAWSEKGLG